MEQITLDRLFRRTKVVEMPDGAKVKVRALSDIEMQERNRTGLAARHVAEKRLRDHDSLEYKATLLPLEEAEADQLRATLFVYQRFDLSSLANEKYPYLYVPEPDEATEAEKLETITRREEREKEINDKREVWMKAEADRYAETLDKKDDDWLRRECARRTAEFFGREAFAEAVTSYEIYRSVENLDGSRYFENQAEVGNVPTAVKTKLYGEMREVNSLDPLPSPGPSVMASPPEPGS